MPKGSAELIAARREEIVAACAKLYQTMSFKDITLQRIGEITTFTRTSIYNYFHTKEEIFLALLQKEYELWIAELDELTESRDSLTVDELAHALAESLEHRRQLLKLMSMNHYDMEMNSRMENLVEFKRAFGESLRAVERCLEKFCPWLSPADREDFIYAFFPFIYGIYPYAIVSEEQREAMRQANVGFVEHSIYDIAYGFTKKLIADRDGPQKKIFNV